MDTVFTTGFLDFSFDSMRIILAAGSNFRLVALSFFGPALRPLTEGCAGQGRLQKLQISVDMWFGETRIVIY